jgi:cytochrome c oxidase subunit II
MKRLMSALLVLATMSSFVRPVAAEGETLEALLAAGEPIYKANCAACHSIGGKGLVGPSFIGNDRIANDEHVLRQISGGSEDMPPFSKKLTPEQIIAVGTFVRNSWGNGYGILAAE